MIKNLFKLGSFKKDVIWAALGNFSLSIKSFFLLKIITSIGKFEYGLFSQIRHTASILVPILSLGLLSSIIRFADGKDDEKRVFSILLFSIINFFILALILKFTKISTIFFGTYDSVFVNILILWLLIHLLDQIFLSYLLAKRQFKVRGLIFAIFSILDIGIIYYIKTISHNIYAILYYLIISMFVSLIIKLLFFDFKKIALISLKPMISFSIMIFLGGVFGIIINYGDRYVITNYYDMKQVGVYSAIYSITNLILILLQPIEQALYPNISYYWNNNKIKDVINYIKISVKYELIIGIIVVLFINIFKKQFITTLTNDSFLDAENLVFPLSIGLFFFVISVPFFRIVSFVKTFYIFFISILLGVFNLFGNILAIKHYGLLGPAYVTFITNLLYFILFFSLAMRILRDKLMIVKKT